MTGEKTAPEDSRPDPGKAISTGKKALFTITFGLLCVVPVALIEVGLRIAGCGFDTRPFIVPPCLDDYYVTNTNLFKKYFPRKALTRPETLRNMMISNIFSRKKAGATLRGFIVGESTAQGFPYPCNQSFGKITELALQAGGKYAKVEVLNMGVSAISSYCVRDMAAKLLAYQPDFLVVYAGHNEYYGTVSTATGGNFFSKNLFLALNEFRIFQLLFNFRNIIQPPKEYPTLMEEQFSQHTLPIRSDEMDREVADNFIKNIDAIVREYQRRHVPVIIIEPVSNLYDMPPFAGEKDADFKAFIQHYDTVVRQNNIPELEAFYQARLPRKQYDGNANVRYLDAEARKALTGKTDLGDFKAARELDAIPFRAKEVLTNKLRDYCRDHCAEASNLYFIPLEEIMTQANGPEALGNRFFIDHLHFTQAGQRFISRILAERIADIFHFNEAEKGKVADFYKDDTRITQAIYYLPACRTGVYLTLRNLTGNPPYNRMLIPYHRDDVDGLTEAALDPQLVTLIQDAKTQDMDPAIIIASSYINSGKIQEGQQYLNLYLWEYPGCYRPYLIQARFRSMFTRDVSGPFAVYKTAYLLSDKMKEIYDEIDGFLTAHKRRDFFTEIEKFGKPSP